MTHGGEDVVLQHGVNEGDPVVQPGQLAALAAPVRQPDAAEDAAVVIAAQAQLLVYVLLVQGHLTTTVYS